MHLVKFYHQNGGLFSYRRDQLMGCQDQSCSVEKNSFVGSLSRDLTAGSGMRLA